MLQIKWRAACCTIPSSLASDDLYDDAASKQLKVIESKLEIEKVILLVEKLLVIES